ncbi:MAG: hypothetical protein R3E88_00135 [Myxococcota bacterium]
MSSPAAPSPSVARRASRGAPDRSCPRAGARRGLRASASAPLPLLAVLVAAVLAAGVVSAEPVDDGLLELGRDRASAIAALGRPPVRCAALPGDRTELCEWHFGDRDAAWRPLARAIRTDARVGLVCRFERESGARVARGCEAFPRRSNREEFVALRRYGKRGLKQQAENERAREARAQALAELGSARTLDAVVGVVGAVPEECVADADDALCSWRTTSHTPGHGTLAASIAASPRKKIRLACRFPRDGSPSSSSPCTAAVGD